MQKLFQTPDLATREYFVVLGSDVSTPGPLPKEMRGFGPFESVDEANCFASEAGVPYAILRGHLVEVAGSGAVFRPRYVVYRWRG